jgi:hypothetical protein
MSMQRFSRFTVVCLILNRTIGSAIFNQPINVLFPTDSSAVAILVWVVGGLIGFALMLCWLEWALTVSGHFIDDSLQSTRIRSGGEKNYVGNVLGPQKHRQLTNLVCSWSTSTTAIAF